MGQRVTHAGAGAHQAGLEGDEGLVRDVGARLLLLLHGGADAHDHTAEAVVGVEEHGVALHGCDHARFIILVNFAQHGNHGVAEAQALHSLVVVARLAKPVPPQPGAGQVLLLDVAPGHLVGLFHVAEGGEVLAVEAHHQDGHDTEDQGYGDGVHAQVAGGQEAQEQEEAGLTLENGQQHQAHADGGKQAAHDAQGIQHPAAEGRRDAVQSGGAHIQDHKRQNEADDGFDDVGNIDVDPRNGPVLALIDHLVGQGDEEALAGHGQHFDHRAQQAHGDGQGQGGVGVQPADQGEGGTHDTRHARVGGQGASGGNDAQIYDVDGGADDGALDRVTQDEAHHQAGDQRPVDGGPLPHGTEGPADVGKAVPKRDQANLQRTDTHISPS